MIKIENVEICGWESAIRGMRNPMNSWQRSDTTVSDYDKVTGFPIIGLNDLELMMKLSKAGSDHSKYLRMITVYADITAPDYWFKEFDTYRVGVTENSTSTMHRIACKEFEIDDFSTDHLNKRSTRNLNELINVLNACRRDYIETQDKEYWWQMIQLLPMSYNYRRTVCFNYAVLKNMYNARKCHKLDEWREFCKWVENLPYSMLITGKIPKGE